MIAKVGRKRTSRIGANGLEHKVRAEVVPRTALLISRPSACVTNLFALRSFNGDGPPHTIFVVGAVVLEACHDGNGCDPQQVHQEDAKETQNDSL